MPSSRTHLNIVELNLNKLMLKEPKKQDDIYYCRFQYDSHTKVFITLSSVKLVKVKTMSPTSHIVTLKLPSLCITPLIDLEEAVVEQTKTNCSKWFNNSLTPALVEEYFSSNLGIDKEHGEVYKFMVQVLPFTENQAAPIGMHGDAVLQLLGVRYYKKRFTIIWALEKFTPYETHPESEDDDIPLDEDEDLFDPDITQTMKADLLAKAKAALEKLDARRTEVQNCVQRLESGKRLNFSVFDSVSEVLDHTSM